MASKRNGEFTGYARKLETSHNEKAKSLECECSQRRGASLMAQCFSSQRYTEPLWPLGLSRLVRWPAERKDSGDAMLAHGRVQSRTKEEHILQILGTKRLPVPRFFFYFEPSCTRRVCLLRLFLVKGLPLCCCLSHFAPCT